MSAPQRIAICGAGISGLTLAGILSRGRPGALVQVFERASHDRDQGYGLDLDEHGQEALVLAGCYDKYWSIARPKSDSMAFWHPSAQHPDAEPFALMYTPRWLKKWNPGGNFADRPECNREALRDILLMAISERPNTSVKYNVAVGDIRCTDDQKAEVYDRDENSLGTFDLIVDATGLHSPLRHHVVHDSQGKHYEGFVTFHGMLANPEETFPPEMMKRFSPYGTAGVLGKGYMLFFQRYGAGSDNRTAAFYNVPHPTGEDAIFDELGIKKPTNRESGIMRDPERLDKIKQWIKNDMGNRIDEIWKQGVDSLERITVRGSMTHGDTILRNDRSLPIVCIGDSLRNCGLGGGGMLAMQDANELGKAIIESSGGIDIDEIMKPMLERKKEHMEEKERRNAHFFKRDDSDASIDLEWQDVREVYSLPAYIGMRIFGPILTGIAKRGFAADLARGELGAIPEHPLVYATVKACLDEKPM